MSEINNKNGASSEFSGERACLGEMRLRLVSEQTELFSPSVGGRGGGLFLEEEDGSGISFPPDDVPDVEKSMTEMSCIASAEICGGRMEIVYDDASVDPDSPAVKTKISFELSSPETVVIERSGTVGSVMIFEQGRFHRCEYVTPILRFEAAVFSRTVENTVGEAGGRLYLDYAVELKGGAAIRTKMNIEIAPFAGA